MGSDDRDPREQALERLDGIERDLGALAAEAGRLRDMIAALRSSVASIELAPAAAGDDELAGARLVALDLVLAGAARDEAVLQMAADYPDVDVAALVDEALAAQG